MRRVPTNLRDYVRQFRERRNVEWEAALLRWLEGEAEYRIDEVKRRVIQGENYSVAVGGGRRKGGGRGEIAD